MPPKKRASIGRVDPKAKRVRDQRLGETSEQRQDRLESNRARIAEARATQTLEEREANLSQTRLRLAALRASESQENRNSRLEDDRVRHAETRSQETAEQREHRLEENRLRTAEIRSQETEEQREYRLEENRLRTAETRSQETAEQREYRLEENRLRTAETRSQETAEQREYRLEENRLRSAEIRSQETAEQREYRLEENRLRSAEIRSQETAEQREYRLEENRLRTAEARSQETADQREYRLEENRLRTAETRSQETAEQRESRLDRDRIRTAEFRREETDAAHSVRLEQDRARHVHARQRSRQVDLKLAAFSYNAQFDYSTHPKVQIGKMDVVCDKCQAKKFKAEPPGMCCSSGKVDLPPLREPPEPLRSYMCGTSAVSKHFLQNIRKYNACFQMTSFGTTVATPDVEEHGFMPTFKVQGQIYHRAGSLLPCGDESPKFLQLYFVCDEELQANQRCSIIGGTRSDVVIQLQRMLHQHNDLVNDFKTALEQMPTDEYKVIIRADRRPAGQHERRFNVPSVSEMAVVLVGLEDCDRRDIIIQKRCEALQRISETHRSYDALQYPLMFWDGIDGYHFELWQRNPSTGAPTNKKVSAMDFYAHRIMIRSTSFNHVVKCRQLFHQFVVDMYAKIESERLLFIRRNQRKLRADDYIHLRDAVAEDGNVTDLGQMVILPSSFTGGPRHMHEYTQDAMAYVRAYGRPDLFITFTCNPAWTEIAEELFTGEAPSDRHDITARVFKQKLTKLMDVLTKSHVYGDTRCWMYTVEWQKRGLPHAHILVWLKERIRPDQIDNIISAELPSREEDPLLFDVVLKNMIHGPCGPLNPRSPCMKENKCTKRYPRQLIRETQTGTDGYPLYRRRKPDDGGHTAVIKMKMDRQTVDVAVDNSWVVPYTPLLSKMFRAHINVEYCNSVKSIKYVCKYVNKGSDMAAFNLAHATAPVDEIERYQTGRYISSNEAVWRILGFRIHEHYPPVTHLHVHLENGQRVYFTADNARQRAAQPPQTTLTAFFLLCQHDPFARTLLYPEVPRYYTWNKSTKKWARRKQGAEVPGYDVRAADVLARVYTVHPNQAECFYLRLLLHTIRGPTSFAALRTIDGEVCETYREACQRLGLLEDDQHWDRTLAEASATSFAPQLRSLFAIILTTCQPSNPRALWEKYREALSEDILRECRRAAPSADIDYSPEMFNQALILLEDTCASMTGQTLRQLGLPSPRRGDGQELESDVLRERSYDADQLSRFVESNVPLLTEDQELAYRAVLDTIASGNGGLLFLDAPGGTGKTFLINLLLAEIRRQGGIALAVASSGIAATLLEGGRTAHSAFKLPLEIARSEQPICGISKGTGKAKVLQEAKLIVWDECTMAHKKSLEALDFTLQDIRGSNRLMGGAVVLLAGDFRQTLPVIPRSTPADELNAYLKASPLWRHVRSLNLTTNMRVHLLGDETARSFAQQLLHLGEGRIPIDPNSGMITFPPEFCNMVQSVEELIEKVFPSIATNFNNGEWICERAILAPKNEQVNSINAQILNSLPGPVVTYTSVDTMVQREQAVYFPTEFLNSLEPNGIPPHRLDLKVGLPIMLLRNINPPKLCNGTRLCIKNLMPNVIEATILVGKFKGEVAFIPRIPLIPSDMPFDFKRLQFPVRPALAMTINKAQGQSLRTVGVDLETPCFSHGQLYVACSRVGSPANLYIYAPEGKTANVVYPTALS